MTDTTLARPAGSPALGGDPLDTRSRRLALVRLLVVLVAGVVLAAVLHGLAVLVVILALFAMVMLHEFGHFVTAKLSGMKVTEYFLGFGPRLWSVRYGETEYGVKGIPAGGYVRIVGMTQLEEVDPADEARSFRQATFPRRVLVGVAGSAMHFIIAFGLLWAMFSFTGVPVAADNEIASVATFAHVAGPAKLAGLRPGDRILGVDGRRYSNINDVVSAIESHANEKITLLVERNGRDLTKTITPVDGRKVLVEVSGRAVQAKTGPKPVGFIGVSLGVTNEQTTNPLIALQRGGAMLGSVTSQTFAGFGAIFSVHGLRSFFHSVATAGDRTSSGGSGTTGASASSGSQGSGQLLSIVGAVEISAQAAGRNVSELLYILVAINIFVGIFNLVPMLPLDGGHVAIAIYERVRTRRGRAPYHADVAKLMPFVYLFLAFMLVIGLGAMYSNIVNPVSLPGG